MRVVTGLTVIISVVLAAFAGWLALSPRPATSRASAAVGVDDAPKRAASSERDRPPRQTWQPRAASPLEAAADPIEDIDDGDALESPAPELAEQAAAHESGLADRLQQESRDAEWSTAAEAAIKHALASDTFVGARLKHAQCRSTMCQVEVDFSDEEALDRFLENAPRTPPFATNGMIRRSNEPEQPGVVAYFAREGHRI